MKYLYDQIHEITRILRAKTNEGALVWKQLGNTGERFQTEIGKNTILLFKSKEVYYLDVSTESEGEEEKNKRKTIAHQRFNKRGDDFERDMYPSIAELYEMIKARLVKNQLDDLINELRKI